MRSLDGDCLSKWSKTGDEITLNQNIVLNLSCVSSSRVSLQSVDLTGSLPRSRSSSLQSSDSLKTFSAGVLSLRVHEARKLEKKGMFGKADPYVLVTFGPTKTRSKTVNNNQVICETVRYTAYTLMPALRIQPGTGRRD